MNSGMYIILVWIAVGVALLSLPWLIYRRNRRLAAEKQDAFTYTDCIKAEVVGVAVSLILIWLFNHELASVPINNYGILFGLLGLVFNLCNGFMRENKKSTIARWCCCILLSMITVVGVCFAYVVTVWGK